MPRLGITALTSVPLMRNPCAVSSLVSRNSIVTPGFTTKRDGVKVNRSAVTCTTRPCVWAGAPAPAVANNATMSDVFRKIVDVMSEPPSESYGEPVGRFHDAALIAQAHVVDFHGNVRIRVVRHAGPEGVAIEFFQGLEARRHPVLRVEVLVARKGNQILGDATGPDAIRRFAVEAAQCAGDVR